jgi:uncharacterized Zn finger protein (UPF0148 family)
MLQHHCPDGKSVNLVSFPCPFCGQKWTDQEDEKLIRKQEREAKRKEKDAKLAKSGTPG